MGACFLLNKKEALYELIQENDDEERNGGQAGSLWFPAKGIIQSGLTNDRKQCLCYVMYPVCMAPRPHSSISE